MASETFVIFTGSTHWHIAARRGSAKDPGPKLADVAVEGMPPGDFGRRVRDALEEQGWRGERVVLALPSAYCWCASISTAGLPRRERHQAMLYRLEEKLPVSAEEVAAVFVARAGQDEQALGVAVATSRLAPPMAALEAAGINVASVCPAALLALQSLLHRLGRAEPIDAVLWTDGSATELFLIDGHRPIGWYHLAGPASSALPRLRLHAGERGGGGGGALIRLLTIGLDAAAVESFGREPALRLEVGTTESLESAAVAGAAEFRAGRLRPWVDFGGGGSGGGIGRSRRAEIPRRAALLASLVLLLALCAAMTWRGHQYRRLAAELDEQQRTLFRRALPGQNEPANPRSRLASEARKLAPAATGTTNEPSAAAAARRSVLPLLLRTLAAMSVDVPFVATELRLTGEELYLEGQVRSHADAADLAAALRRDGGFQVELPQSEQSGDGSVVRFTLTARLRTGTGTSAEASADRRGGRAGVGASGGNLE